ncbi:MAG TPA: hypothetical protein VLF69_03875 [Candidatus Saccharimonadales bacterium]|nr:hypothetical protein [Candidatus Saccharimonadales bacterium]
MKSLRFLDRRAGYSLGAIGLLVGMVAPAVFPAFASAGQLSSRSVEMSSSKQNDTGVKYTISFTPTATYGAFVVDFCGDSPIIGDSSCTTPTSFSVSSATVAQTTGSIGTLDTTGTSGNHLVVTGSSTSSAASVFEVSGVHNPNTLGTFYARIYTYAGNDASSYTDFSDPGTNVDTGGAAMSIADTIGVTATVKETLTFCVSGNGSTNGGDAIDTSNGPSGACGADGGANATGVYSPDIVLGHGSPLTLDSSQADSGYDWVQLSTNASGGAIVRLRDTTTDNCGGLERTGASICDIAPAGSSATAITGGIAKFGLRLSNEQSAPHAVATSTTTISPTAPYNNGSNYGFDNTTSGNTVSGTYGSNVMSTSGSVANRDIMLNFAASAAPTTPAGIYKATLDLIATGTY